MIHVVQVGLSRLLSQREREREKNYAELEPWRNIKRGCSQLSHSHFLQRLYLMWFHLPPLFLPIACATICVRLCVFAFVCSHLWSPPPSPTPHPSSPTGGIPIPRMETSLRLVPGRYHSDDMRGRGRGIWYSHTSRRLSYMILHALQWSFIHTYMYTFYYNSILIHDIISFIYLCTVFTYNTSIYKYILSLISFTKYLQYVCVLFVFSIIPNLLLTIYLHMNHLDAVGVVPSSPRLLPIYLMWRYGLRRRVRHGRDDLGSLD